MIQRYVLEYNAREKQYHFDTITRTTRSPDWVKIDEFTGTEVQAVKWWKKARAKHQASVTLSIQHRLGEYYRTLSPHLRERTAAKLIKEALDRIEFLEEILENVCEYRDHGGVEEALSLWLDPVTAEDEARLQNQESIENRP